VGAVCVVRFGPVDCDVVGGDGNNLADEVRVEAGSYFVPDGEGVWR